MYGPPRTPSVGGSPQTARTSARTARPRAPAADRPAQPAPGDAVYI
ncbi:hypothetical protein HMPREF0569_0625 [Micrococcus luteus SK58]|nr:hypothetical protein HMPREF0569_0625 [Micrococcus luteus SK58]